MPGVFNFPPQLLHGSALECSKISQRVQMFTLFKPTGLYGTIILCIYGTTETNWFNEHENLKPLVYFGTPYSAYIWTTLSTSCAPSCRPFGVVRWRHYLLGTWQDRKYFCVHFFWSIITPKPIIPRKVSTLHFLKGHGIHLIERKINHVLWGMTCHEESVSGMSSWHQILWLCLTAQLESPVFIFKIFQVVHR